MDEPDTPPAAIDPVEAWLDFVLLATMIAVAPYEWGARMVIAWTRPADRDR